MNQNIYDRFFRILLGGVMVLSGGYIHMSNLVLWAVTVIGLFIMLTGLCGFCPFYHLFKINTYKK